MKTSALNAAAKRRYSAYKSVPLPIILNPGKLDYISISSLTINKQYQRPINLNMVTRIVANWNWAACGTLLVSINEDNSYNIIDGQHRWEAAKLAKISKLPCIIFSLDSVRDEAASWLAVNIDRKVPNSVDRFAAQCEAEDILATKIQALASSANRLVKKERGSNSLNCLGELSRALYANEGALQRVWPTIVEICRGHHIPGNLIKGVWWLETKMPKDISLSQSYWSERLINIGFANLVEEIERVCKISQKKGEPDCATAILNCINKRRKAPINVQL